MTKLQINKENKNDSTELKIFNLNSKMGTEQYSNEREVEKYKQLYWKNVTFRKSLSHKLNNTNFKLIDIRPQSMLKCKQDRAWETMRTEPRKCLCWQRDSNVNLNPSCSK